MNRLTKRVFHIPDVMAGVTGVAYAVVKWVLPVPEPAPGEFSLPIHPFEPLLKTLHVLLSFALIFSIGWIWHSHVIHQWRRFRKNPESSRKLYSGLALLALAAPMIVSAFAFQVSVEDSARQFWSQMHLWSGLAWIGASTLHWLARRV